MNKMKPLFKRLKKEKIPLAPQTVFESALMDELNI